MYIFIHQNFVHLTLLKRKAAAAASPNISKKDVISQFLFSRPGDAEVEQSRGDTAGQRQVQLPVAVPLAQQLGNSQRYAPKEDLVGRPYAVVVPQFNRNAGFLHKEVFARLGADGVPHRIEGVVDRVGDAGDAAGAVFDR